MMRQSKSLDKKVKTNFPNMYKIVGKNDIYTTKSAEKSSDEKHYS